MVERILIAGIALLVFAIAVRLGRAWYSRRNKRIEAHVRSRISTHTGGGKRAPRIIYFTTRTCAICKSQQEPAIEAVSERRPELIVERHDAVENAELADEFGVLSVPTTAVYDRRGELVAINRGFTPAAALLAQIDDREVALDGGAQMVSEPVE